MANGRLTDLKIRKAKSGKLLDGDGLLLQIRGDSRVWIYRYRRKNHLSKAGKPLSRELGLGPYPLFSLAEARELRDENRKLLFKGIDPIEARRAREATEAAEKAKAKTFKTCAEEYIETHRHSWKSAVHAAQWTATLKKWVYPIIGELQVADIDSSLVLKVMNQRVAEETFWLARTETASRVRGRIESIMGYAKAQKLRPDNPALWSDIGPLLPKKSHVAEIVHHKAIHYRDMPAFMAALRSTEGTTARALEFVILCACRTGDVMGAVWSEIDRKAKTWTIPGKRLKAKKGKPRPDHVIPLAPRALKILDGLEGGAGSIFNVPNNLALLYLLRDIQSDQEMTVHGFRSSFRDWAAERTNYPSDVAEMALAHAISSKVEAAYRRGDLLEKRTRLMVDWCDYCASPPASTQDNVVPLRA